MPIAPPFGIANPYGASVANSVLDPAQQQVPFPQIPVSAPQNYASNQFNSPTRGIASLSFQGRTWRFRTNPNSVWWAYTLNTNVEQTYGGRVVQILSTRIDDMIVKVECGNGDTGGVNGGWQYNYNLVLFLRDLLVAQRDPMAPPATFSYTTRRWKFNVYGLTIPFGDSVDATTRELELHFKVQEDVTGVVSGAIMDATLAKLRDGIGWTRNKYNSGSVYPKSGQGGTSGGGNINPGGTQGAQNTGYQDPQSGPFPITGFQSISGLFSGANIPGLSSVLGSLGGIIGV